MKKLRPLSELIPMLVHVMGKPMRIKDYVLFKSFYDSKASRRMIKAGRQVGKSTSIAAYQIVVASLVRYMSMLTGFPLKDQAHRFSKLAIDSMIRQSPELQSRFDNKDMHSNVMMKSLNNESFLHFAYIGDSADRVRGLAIKRMFWDEVQDIESMNIPIAEQCTSSFVDARFTYTGTPKTKDNTIETYWLRSSMSEPVVRCSRCKFDNYCILPNVHKMLEPKGLTCQHCRKLIPIDDVHSAFYVHGNPDKVGVFDGFHIPQIFVPFNLHPKRWSKIMLDYSEYGEFEFSTEVLGISRDLGGRPVSLEDLLKCCTERRMGSFMRKDYQHIIMGVDWGCSVQRSCTVVAIIGKNHQNKFDLLFAKKYHYIDRTLQVEELCKLFSDYSCTAVGADYGVGQGSNFSLRHAIGFDRLWEFQYCQASYNVKFMADKLRHMLNRTMSLDLMFTALKRGEVSFPVKEESKPFFDDILSIYEDMRTTPSGVQKYFDKNASIPDDFAHSLNFAIVTSRLIDQDPIFKPALF